MQYIRWVRRARELALRGKSGTAGDVSSLVWTVRERQVSSRFSFYCVALMNTLCHNGKEDTVPTVGFNIETVKVKKLSLDLWARRWQNGL